MVDLAVNDSRSVAAMLRNKGDGREKVWLRHERKHEAVMTQEQIQAAFTKAVRYGRIGSREETIRKIKKSLLIALGVLIIVA